MSQSLARIICVTSLSSVLVLLIVACGDGRDFMMKEGASQMPVSSMASNAMGVDSVEGSAGTWKRSRKVPNTSRLMIGDEQSLPLKGVHAGVRIDGDRARVMLDLYYYNDRDRQYEGTFMLRLPNGATPMYLAFGQTAYRAADGPRGGSGSDQSVFDSAGQFREMEFSPATILQMREHRMDQVKEAVMASRDKASLSYHETVARRIDPALMEWAGAGVFQARVFPLAPKQLHRIVIGYDVDLIRHGDDLEYRLDLPAELENYVVDVSVADLAGEGDDAATRIATSPTAQGVRGDGRVYYRLEGARGAEPKAVTVTQRNTGDVMLVGAEKDRGEYFARTITPQLPPADGAAGSDRAVFLVDTSLSANPDRFNIYLKLLQATLENNRDSIRSFNVMFFDVQQHWWRNGFVANDAANVDALWRYAQQLSLQGATDLSGALARLKSAAWLQADEGDTPVDLFLLSDGAATWGEDDVHRLTADLRAATSGPLFAYQTGLTGEDNRMLAHLTRETGGAVFTVLGDQQVASASRAHRSRPWRLLDVQVEGGRDLLLQGRPRVVFPGQSLRLVGRGRPEADATVRLSLERDGERRVVAHPAARVVSSELTARLYGQVATAQLEDLSHATSEVAGAYARHFRVTGRSASLVMLESQADYERFNIHPRNDASVVASTTASSVIREAMIQLANTLADPKTAFKMMLKQLEQTAGVQFRQSEALAALMTQMHGDEFELPATRLTVKSLTWSTVPDDVRRTLLATEPDLKRLSQFGESVVEEYGAPDALRAVSSLVEARPGDLSIARQVGFTALAWNEPGHAYHLFRRLQAARPYEPHSYHAMALCLEQMGRPRLAMAHYEIVLAGQWDQRFGELKRFVAMDYAHLLRSVAREGGDEAKQFATGREAQIRRLTQRDRADLVVMMMWNTDRTDVDLHVREPGGEECYYQHPRTTTGGTITADVTQGFGPEMYVLPDAPTGSYQVLAKYFAADRNRETTRTRVYLTTYANWGTPWETVSRKTVVLNDASHMQRVTTLQIRNSGEATLKP